MQVLDISFYEREDVVQIARELLGKIICTQFDGVLTTARIVETEAYNGIVDKASHAYGGRNTRRTAVMFGEAGYAYVYLCYGIHHLFNVVTNQQGIPHAVLIRAAEPLQGIDYMFSRMGKIKADYSVTRGPGNVSKALGINTSQTGFSLLQPPLWLAKDDFELRASEIVATPRIGVDYAAEDALLPYRFFIKGNKYVSGRPVRSHLRGKGENEFQHILSRRFSVIELKTIWQTRNQCCIEAPLTPWGGAGERGCARISDT